VAAATWGPSAATCAKQMLLVPKCQPKSCCSCNRSTQRTTDTAGAYSPVLLCHTLVLILSVTAGALSSNLALSLQLLGRADNLKDFIRRGADSGWVETTLSGGPGRPDKIIRCEMRKTAEGYSTNWRINGARGFVFGRGASERGLVYVCCRERECMHASTLCPRGCREGGWQCVERSGVAAGGSAGEP
jgi:hypothetical protein